MNLPRHGSLVSGVSEEALPRLTEARLPPRVRSLLEGMLDYAADDLERKLVQAVNEFEQQLFKLADQPRNTAGQQKCFETLREVKRGRSDIVPRFMMRLEASLAMMRPLAYGKRADNKGSDSELSLVEDSELEVDGVMREISSRAEVRNSLPLYLMGQRFGVLAGSPALEPETIPIGPRGLCEAMRSACSFLDIPVEHRVLMFRQFDRLVMTPIGPFFEALNTYLVQQRVLPNLSFVPVRGKPQARSAAEEKTAKAKKAGAAAEPEAEAPMTQEPEQWAGRGPAAARGGHAAQRRQGAKPGSHRGFGPAPDEGHGNQSDHPQAPEAAPRPGIMPRFFQGPQLPRGDAPPAPDAHADTTAIEDPRDVELFETIRELMAGRRNVLGKFSKEPANAFSVSTDDVESVLGALQQKPAPSIVVGGKVQARTVGALKQEVMAQLRRVTPEGQVPKLSDQDSDTIDLVGMLFDYIVRDLKPSGVSQYLLSKLQAPVLRTALRDRGFFTQRNHPARQLLNSIAETGMHWLDTGDADRGLVEKMQLLVDRVTTDFDGDVGLFETLLGDLSRHMHTVARKAEVAERRHVDAARGRERLALARVHAGEEVAKRLAGHRIPKLLSQVLEQTWTDVLALTELRQGADSELYGKRLEVADQLVAACSARSTDGKSATPLPDTKQLRADVEAGLAQVGHHGSDIQAIVSAVFDTEDTTKSEHAEPASRTEIAMRLKARARLGADISEDAVDVRKGKLSEADKAAVARIRSLPFGTWFEFTVNQQGDRQRRRLSWFSTVTGRCLFVNQRGQRVDERSMLALAREMQRGDVRIVEPESEGLIDKAWQAIVGALRHFSGKAAAAH